MRTRILALVSVATLGLAACTGDTADDGPGVVVRETVDETVSLYSPESRMALDLGLPDQIGGLPLLSPGGAELREEEEEYATDPRIRQILVEGGLDPGRVTVAQKSARFVGPSTATERISPVNLAAIQIKDVPAQRLVDWDSSFYMLSTAIGADDYEWQGEKPGNIPTRIAGLDVSLADYTRFKVAWYAHGDVLYVVVAASDELVEEAIRRLPRPSDAT